jgi:hypothetical protein
VPRSTRPASACQRHTTVSAGALESLALVCGPQVDPREEHGQLRRLEFDAVLCDGMRQLKGAGLEAFVQDGQFIAVKVEDLDPIPAAVDEEEEMAGQGGSRGKTGFTVRLLCIIIHQCCA